MSSPVDAARRIAAASGVDPMSLPAESAQELGELASTMLRKQMAMFHPDLRGYGDHIELFHEAADAAHRASEAGVEHLYALLRKSESSDIVAAASDLRATVSIEKATSEHARKLIARARDHTRAVRSGGSFAGCELIVEDLELRANEAGVLLTEIDRERRHHDRIGADRLRGLSQVLELFQCSESDPVTWERFCREEEVQTEAFRLIPEHKLTELEESLIARNELSLSAWFRKFRAKFPDAWDRAVELCGPSAQRALDVLDLQILRKDCANAQAARCTAIACLFPSSIGAPMVKVLEKLRQQYADSVAPECSDDIDREMYVLPVEYVCAGYTENIFEWAEKAFGRELRGYGVLLHSEDVVRPKDRRRTSFSATTVRHDDTIEAPLQRRLTKPVVLGSHATPENPLIDSEGIVDVSIPEKLLAESTDARSFALREKDGQWVASDRGGTERSITPLGLIFLHQENVPGTTQHGVLRHVGRTMLRLPISSIENDETAPVRKRDPDAMPDQIRYHLFDITRQVDRETAAHLAVIMETRFDSRRAEKGTVALVIALVEGDENCSIRVIGRLLRASRHGEAVFPTPEPAPGQLS